MGDANKLERTIDASQILFGFLLLLPWGSSLIFQLLFLRRSDLWPVLAGFVSFFTFNSLLFSQSPSLFPRLPLSSLDLFTNTSVSLIHSTLVGISVSVVLVWEFIVKGWQMFSHEELFSGEWEGSKFILCLSSGYFAYDQVDMLRRHLYDPNAPSLLAHHAVLLVCFTMALYRQVTINYLILTLFCEVRRTLKAESTRWMHHLTVPNVCLLLQLHSIFLHLRRVLKMARLRKERSYWFIVEWTLNWFTFFTSRIVTHVFITAKLIADISEFPSGIEWPLAISGMVGLNILNAILGLDLLKAFWKEASVWTK